MDYKKIYNSTIFDQSQCIYKENSFVDFLRTLLIGRGYTNVDQRRFIWQKDQRRVWIAMVDDIENLNYDCVDNFLDQFTADDLIITDSWFNRPVRARLLQVPNSWFGIYAHRPASVAPTPTHKFAMPVNRIDYNRLMIFLEMGYRGYIDNRSLVNFNCARHTDSEDTSDQLQLWQSNWQNIDPYYKEIYQHVYAEYSQRIPFTNHQLDIDMQCQRALVNIVVETYTGDHSAAVSEKIFRVLVTPRPWRVFGGTWTVARLKQLGFDCLDDIVDHDTDGIKMIEDKISKFVKSCAVTWDSLSWPSIADRCHVAAATNQQLLESMQRRWADDLVAWLPRFVEEI